MIDKRPPNANSNLINTLGLFAAILAYFYCREFMLTDSVAGIVVAGAYAVVIIILELIFLRTPLRETTGLDFTKRETSPPRIAIKLIGVYGSYGFVWFMYWLFPEYNGSYYDRYYEGLRMLAPYVIVLTIPYVIFIDERMKEPKDSYYWFGKFLLLDWENVKPVTIIQHLLGWVVKGFFMPLMFIAFIGNINHLHNVDFATTFESFDRFYRTTVDIMFTIDVLAAVAGYAISMRLFDNQIRSSEPTFFGWFVCLICYQPFLSIFMRYYLAYSSNNWMVLLKDYPTIQILWGSALLAALFVYTAASVNFGIRFSNITHRGILTKGMYRFTKHPAYVAKNSFWWFVYIPFIPMSYDMFEAFRYVLLMAGISGVYYLRAYTEERHLSRDPAYVRYALYMNDHSVFRGVARYAKFLRYKPPQDWETRLPEPYMGMK